MTLQSITAALLIILFFSSAYADEYRPAFLELKQTSPEEFDVLWKVPVVGGLRPDIQIQFAEEAELNAPVGVSLDRDAYIERFSLRRNGGLAGTEIVIEGFSGLITEALVRIERLNGSPEIARLTVVNPTYLVQGSLARRKVASTYTLFGIEHILPLSLEVSIAYS